MQLAHGASWSEWDEEPGSCDGARAEVVASKTCLIPMSALEAAPFGLVYGDPILVRAQAENLYGWGDLSVAAGALTLRTLPAQMPRPRARQARPPPSCASAGRRWSSGRPREEPR